MGGLAPRSWRPDLYRFARPRRIVQLVFNPERNPAAHEIAQAARVGILPGGAGYGRCARSESTINADLPTGEIEIIVSECEVLNQSLPRHFRWAKLRLADELRLKYRYLDLRRTEMQRNLRLRHHALRGARAYLDDNGFVEMETPILFRATPEGARDYLVPSRVNPGSFYALPQSPQLLKQLLMVGGFDRYYQIARCFRDEDLRANRQPEFSQIDIEMTGPRPEDIMAWPRACWRRFTRWSRASSSSAVSVAPYDEAMDRFGIRQARYALRPGDEESERGFGRHRRSRCSPR